MTQQETTYCKQRIVLAPS
ncbi:hypothetical protein VCHENC01_4133A, partial [Vibrio harveyi]